MSSYEDAVRAGGWLSQNGYCVIPWFGGSWKVRKHMGSALGESQILKTNAQLIEFARSKGWEG